MRTNLYKVSGLLLMVFFFVSCKKSFLEIVPKGKLVASSLKDYDLLMNNTSFYQTTDGDMTMLMGDEVAAEQSYFQNSNISSLRAFAWEDEIYNPGDVVMYVDNRLKNLYICNKIINEVNGVSDGTASQRMALQAEALATRAWINFGFVNYFGNPYKETTATSDPGFPIITEANINAKNFKRSSVKEVYESIINDLKTSIVNLPLKSAFVTRISRPAAKGLLGKVYLYMGQYQDALTQFNGAFADLGNNPSTVSLYNYNVEFAPGGDFLPFGRSGPDYPGNNYMKYKESVLLKTNSLTGINSGIVMRPETMALYTASDLRRQLYSNTHVDLTPIPGGLLRKYTQYAHLGIELPDLILMRAEAKARNQDLEGAKADLKSLRINRMSVDDAEIPASVSTQVDLLKFIIDERTREFAGEGQRWFDMRRLSIDPIFSAQHYKHYMYAADGISIAKSYDLKPVRFTLRLPQAILDANPGMSDNP